MHPTEVVRIAVEAIRAIISLAEGLGQRDAVLSALDAGREFTAAMLAGYRVILAAPEFLLVADPRGGGRTEGGSDARALACRLSLFLWNDRPDAALLAAANDGRLADPARLVAEADRLIEDPRFARFVATFTDHWLDLRHLRRDEPDARFFPEYRFDEYLAESLGRETRASVERLLRDDLPLAKLIDDVKRHSLSFLDGVLR
jgi:hypothetical protein